MADPRHFSGYRGIGYETATFWADDFGAGGATIIYDATQPGGSAQVGLAVKLVSVASGKAEIDLTTDASSVLGRLERVEADGACTVQIAGAMELPAGASATLTLGGKIVGDLDTAAEGYIRSAAPATLAEVAVAVGRILDNSNPAAVEVYL